jgi:hypothetical protein
MCHNLLDFKALPATTVHLVEKLLSLLETSFRQTLPIVKHVPRAQTVNACFKRSNSKLWKNTIELHHFVINMRLRSIYSTPVGYAPLEMELLMKLHQTNYTMT